MQLAAEAAAGIDTNHAKLSRQSSTSFRIIEYPLTVYIVSYLNLRYFSMIYPQIEYGTQIWMLCKMMLELIFFDMFRFQRFLSKECPLDIHFTLKPKPGFMSSMNEMVNKDRGDS